MSSARPAPDPLYVLRGLGAAITSLEFATNRKAGPQQLLCGDNLGVVSLWNLAKKRTDTTLKAHNKSIITVGYLNDDLILSQGREGQVELWKLTGETYDVVKEIKVSDLGFCQCEILNDRVNIAVQGTSSQSEVEVIDVWTNNISAVFEPEQIEQLGMVMCLKDTGVHPGHLLAGYENGELILWTMQSTTKIHKLKLHKEPVMCIDFDTRTQRGVTGSAEDILAIFQLTSEKKLVLEKTVKVKNPGISVVRIRQDSRILATGGWDNKIRIFSWKTLKPLAILNYHSKSIDALAFSNCDEKVLAAGSKDGRISLWSLYKDD